MENYGGSWWLLVAVAAEELVFFVEFGEPGTGLFGNEVGAELGGIQAAADNLFHATFMEVDARPKHAGKR